MIDTVTDFVIVRNGEISLPCGNENLAIRVLNKRNLKTGVTPSDGNYFLVSHMTQDGFSKLALEKSLKK